MKKLCICLIRLYQLTLSPWVGRQCRYIPTCSHYAIEAFEQHGTVRGLYLTIRRLLRCHPLGGHGYDPVPLKFSWRHHCSECQKTQTGQDNKVDDEQSTMNPTTQHTQK